ncbi:glycosyltransferase [Maridesulfovibrio hydrothermalis]|nr:glycosyltransferase [Maridesulfovibrio hydrothermalis]
MRYNAGSEVYSQMLCHGLAKQNEVHVFTREENAFAPDASLRLEHDNDMSEILIHVVNNPRLKDRYRSAQIDQQFAAVLEKIKPDLVHVGHLNHLSTSLLREAKVRNIPIVFTLHDYWLMCPRGQFMQMFPKDPDNLWAACSGQEDQKCAERCYARYFSGASDEYLSDMAYWTEWVRHRMQHVRDMVALVDLFIAPARYLHDRFRDEFGIPDSKMVYIDYGFDHERLKGRSRCDGEPFTFGYIGTHIPAKGIHDLIRAFGLLKGNATLRIWGRPRGQETEALKDIVAELPTDIADRVEWLPEYKNQEIISDVFNRCDAIVVPSVWVENSPLVIHEAQQARVPVITADTGGMAEYVQDGVNGLLFEHRSYTSLASKMQCFVDAPELASRLGSRGYLYTDTGDVPDLESHVHHVEKIYKQLVDCHAPWRITFDTNPELCNLHCVMCERHSRFNTPRSTLSDNAEQVVMPFEMIERVVSSIADKGLKEIIPSTMGEPLLYNDFEKIIDLCTHYGIKLNLTTNGTFPILGVTQWAERIVPVASDVKISWNGATKETYESIMVGSQWEKAVANLKEFISIRDAFVLAGENRCSVTLQMTFMENNLCELVDIIRLAIALGVDRVKGHHLWVHSDQMANQSMRRSKESIQRWNKYVHEAHAVAKEQKLPSGKYVRLENIFTLEEDLLEDIAPGGTCPFLGQEAWISSTGRFEPCCAPDNLRRGLGVFGNLHSDNFMEIWNGKAYAELVGSYKKQSLCQGCNMRKVASEGEF